MSLRLHNTLTLQVEPFVPADGKTVRMYTCGPTVYNFAHIGNLRTFAFEDVLRRWLKARGYQMMHVMNITDVDDKIIRNAGAKRQTIEEYTAEYTKAFEEDTALLRLERPEYMVKATEHIAEMVQAIQALQAKGMTYSSDGSVYFRIAQFPEYGKLSHNDFSGIRAGARVDVDEYDKADARDFVLWKSAKDGEPFWDTPFGPGRPGWHIECSAMAMKYLGETLDIHAGGVDLIFPHHENEIAQSEGITCKPFARFWLHCEFLNVESQKMSKSVGNIYTLRELVAMGYAPETVRYLLISVPYRKKLNFTFDGLKAAATTIERLRNFELRLKSGKFPEGFSQPIAQRAKKALDEFESSLDDDLNTAEALAAIFEYVRAMNSLMDSGEFPAKNVEEAQRLLQRFDGIVDVLRPTWSQSGMADADIDAKIEERSQAKKAKNFKLADQLRADLLEAGIILEDTKDGIRWKRK